MKPCDAPLTTLNALNGVVRNSHPKGALDRLLDGVGIRLVPVRRRRKAAQSHARAAMKAIRASHGDGFLVFVLKVIRQTKGNRDQLHSDTINAVADIFAMRPDWMDMGGAVLDAFDHINLGKLREDATKLRPWPVRTTLRTLIYQQLKGMLDEQKLCP